MDLNSEGLGNMYGTQGARLPGQDQQTQLPGLSQNTGWGFSSPAPGDPQLVDSRLLAGGDNNGGRSLWDQDQMSGLGGVGPGGSQTGDTTKDWVGAGLPVNSRPAATLPNPALANNSSMWPGNGIWAVGQGSELAAPTAAVSNADEPHRLPGFARRNPALTAGLGLNLNQSTADFSFQGQNLFPAQFRADAPASFGMPGSNAMVGNFQSLLDVNRQDDTQMQRILQMRQELVRAEQQRQFDQLQQEQLLLQEQQRHIEMQTLNMQMKALGVGGLGGQGVGPGTVNDTAMMLLLNNQALQSGMNGLGNQFGSGAMSGLHGGLGTGGLNIPGGRPMYINEMGGRGPLNFGLQHARQMEQQPYPMRGPPMYGGMNGGRGFEPPYHREPPYPRHGGGRRVHQRHPPPPPPPPMADRPPPPTKVAVARVPLANLPRSAPDSPGRQVSPRVGYGIPFPRDRAYQKDARPKVGMDVLNDLLLKKVKALQPTEEEQANHEQAFQIVEKVLYEKWPDAKVHLFGSWANGLSITSNNDIDVCLEIDDLPDEQAAKGDIVEKMKAVLLHTEKIADVLGLPKARVPVVKFNVVLSREVFIKVDITVNNILALVNTKLLGDYCKVDERLVQLATIVKSWAKKRNVNDSYRGTLSSYCYVLMCIHLLQQREKPVLPCLHSITPPTVSRMVGPWKCEYMDNVDLVKDFGSENTETLAELVWAFFEYWAWKHDYNNHVISVRTGGFLTKGQKEWTRRVGNERHLVCIEDPFELTHDLGRTVDRQTSGVLHKEFERAACCLRDSEPDPVEKLFDPFRQGPKEVQ